MDWFLYDNGLRHERLKLQILDRSIIDQGENKIIQTFLYARKFQLP